MRQGTTSYLGALLASALVALTLGSGAEGSIPSRLTHLECLQPVTFWYSIPATSAADLAQDAVVFEEVLSSAGLPAPLGEIQHGRMHITTYAASQPDLERLQQLARRKLEFFYPGSRSLREAGFVVSGRYEQQAMEVVARRLKLAGYEGQSGSLGPNRFWVGARTMDRDLQWAWERRGLFEVRLLPPAVRVGFSRGPTPDSPWDLVAVRKNRTVNLTLLVRESPLVVSNRTPMLEANVKVHGQADWSAVSISLAPSAADGMKAMTGQGGRWLAFVWDGRVIEAHEDTRTVEDIPINPPHWRGQASRREAERLGFYLKSGSTPTPLGLEPPKVEIPESVTSFLHTAYPDWRLITYYDYGAGNSWGRFPGQREMLIRGENNYPFAMRGDFDGDGTPDWAVLLKQRDRVRLTALHHAGATWKPHLVSEFSYQTGFQAGLPGFTLYLEPPRKPDLPWMELTPKGHVRRIWDLGTLTDLPGETLELVSPGMAAWLWKWDGGKYRRFVSRD